MKTALSKVHSVITLNMDDGNVTALALLDLPVAFDIINPTIIMDLLPFWYGVFGVV